MDPQDNQGAAAPQDNDSTNTDGGQTPPTFDTNQPANDAGADQGDSANPGSAPVEEPSNPLGQDTEEPTVPAPDAPAPETPADPNQPV